MEIRSLEDVTFGALHRAFLGAFSDYVIPMQPNEEQFRDLIRRRGVDFRLSVGAFIENELVAFNLNAIDRYDGQLTVYDVATGVMPVFRRRGIGTVMFKTSLPWLRETGALRYLLEVIQTNARAVRAYETIGFQRIRELDSFRAPKRLRGLHTKNESCEVKAMSPDWQSFRKFWDWKPSWQNSIRSLTRSNATYSTLGAFQAGALTGYLILFPQSGDIPQFAVKKNSRRQGIGSALFSTAKQHFASGIIPRVVNIPSTDSGTIGFLEHIGFRPLLQQYEMQMPFGT